MKSEDLLAIGLSVVCFGAWVTHVIECVKTDEWALLVVGSLVFPVGVVHGVWLWF